MAVSADGATKPDIPATLTWLRGRLRESSDAAFQEGQFRFFKEEVRTWGVRSAQLGQIERELLKRLRGWPPAERNKLATELWKGGSLEEGAIVCHVWRRYTRDCTLCDFKLFERWLDRYVTNWAHADGLATWLLAATLRQDPARMAEMREWTKSPNRWKRRSAAVAFLQEAKAGRNTGALLEVVTLLASDRDDMVEKGIGWVLKEAYPKQADAIVAYLDEMRGAFSRKTLRYAAEKMTPEHRRQILT